MNITRMRIPDTLQPGPPVSYDASIWRSDRMYAIAFDLDKLALQHHYPGSYIENAYGDICRELAQHRFQRQQGSLYFGDKGTDPVSCFLAVQALEKRYPWFRHVVRDIRMLRIDENNNLMPVLGQGELPLDKSNAA